MAIVVNMPRLSDTMKEGTIATWLKKVGDKIEEGDILAEIETDKATMEFESFNEGTLLHIGVQEGETTKVDALLAIIGNEGEDISNLLNKSTEAEVELDAAPKSDGEAKNSSDIDFTNASSQELPKGVIVVTMPRLSDTMEEGTVATWLKKIGDTVNEGDILAEIETDKATMEFESFQSGTLLHVGLNEGESAKVDALLAIIGPSGTDISNVVSNFKIAISSSKTEKTPKEVLSKIEVKQENLKASIPIAISSSNQRLFISPLAKKMADQKGINLTQVRGTGENGRIIKRDIENFTPATTLVGKFEATGQEDFDDVNNSQMRKAIAKALTNSKFTAPHYYLNVEFDMERAIAFRQQFNSIPNTKISYNDIVVKACALALKRHPQVNSQWFAEKIRLNNHVHIGVAVAVPDGLVVPVVKFASQQTLPQIGAEVKELAGKARNKKLSPQEMEGSTFTVSNLGMFGIESFTSIINQPNSAILSVGNIIEKPVVKNGQVVVGNTMKLSLACDHRIIDGATGAQFLETLRAYIENPVTMVV